MPLREREEEGPPRLGVVPVEDLEAAEPRIDHVVIGGRADRATP